MIRAEGVVWEGLSAVEDAPLVRMNTYLLFASASFLLNFRLFVKKLAMNPYESHRFPPNPQLPQLKRPQPILLLR